MKKLLTVLLLLVVAGAFAFAEANVTVGGDLKMGMTGTGTSATGTFPRSRFNINASLDDNVSVFAQFRDNGASGSWSSYLKYLDASVNVFKAVGLDLPVSLNWKVGKFDGLITNWNYVSRSGREFYTQTAGAWGGRSYLWDMNANDALAWMVTVGYGDFALKYWGDLDFSSMAFAVSGKIASMVNFLVGYSGEIASYGGGSLWAEAGLSLADLGPVSLTVPVSFSYDLGSSEYSWSSGVAADVSMLHVSVGVGGNTSAGFKMIEPEVSVKPIDGLDIWAIGDFDLGANTQSIDLGASYMLGAMKFGVGYVIALQDTTFTHIWGDTMGITGSGLYMAWNFGF